jgi:hypothetical protein
LLKSLPGQQRSSAADDPSDVVRDSLPLNDGTAQIFVLLDRRRSSRVAGGLDIFPDPDDIDARATFKLHRTHQPIDVTNVHLDPLTLLLNASARRHPAQRRKRSGDERGFFARGPMEFRLRSSPRRRKISKAHTVFVSFAIFPNVNFPYYGIRGGYMS